MKRLMCRMGFIWALLLACIASVAAASFTVQPAEDGNLLTVISQNEFNKNTGFTYNVIVEGNGFAYDNRKESATYSVTDSTKTGAVASLQSKSLNALIHNQPLYLEQTLCFETLPVNTLGKEVFIGKKLYGYGYTFFLSNRDDVEVMYQEKVLLATVQNSGNGELVLYIANSRNNSASGSDAIALGVTLGQSFRLGVQWNMNNSADVYVNGVYLDTVHDAMRTVSGMAGKGYYYGIKYGETAGDASFTVSDVKAYGGILPAAKKTEKVPLYKTEEPSEAVWRYPVDFDADGTEVTGSLDGRWNEEYLYLQLTYSGASQLKLNAGSYSKTISLDGSSKMVTIPWKDLGVQLPQSNQTLEMELELCDATGQNSARLSTAVKQLYLDTAAVDPLYSHPKKINYVKNFNVNKQTGVLVLDTESQIDTMTSVDDAEYIVAYLGGKKSSAVIDHYSRNILLKQTVCVEAMPQENYSYDGTGGTGLIITIIDRLTKEDGTLDGSHCELMLASLVNTNTGLQLYVGESAQGIALGKGLRETFNLAIQWNIDDSVDVYVDDRLLATVGDATVYVPYSGTDELTYRYNSLTKQVKLTLSDVKICQSILPANEGLFSQKVLDNLFRELNPDVDAGMVKEDILLPTGYTNKYGQTDTLTWESSMPHVISETGKVCRQQLQCDVVLNVRIDGKIAGSLRLTVAGMDSFTGRQINAAYSNEAIALDGVISEEGWVLNAEAFADGIQLLRMGAQWQKDMLYLAIDTPDLSKLQLMLAGKQLDLNAVNKFTSGTVTELCIPFENLGVVLDEYGDEIPGQVVLNGKVYTFTLSLSSVDWFSTDNAAHRIDHSYSNKVNRSDSGVEQIADGYYLYDHYGAYNYPLNTNSLYLVYPKEDPTLPTINPVWPKDATYYFQCDFLATAMPVYDGSVAGNDVRNATYGVSWFIGGERESAHQDAKADVTLFGIYNNGENLVFVVSGENELASFALDKKVGDAFRLAVAVDRDGNLTAFVDNAPIGVVMNAEKRLSGLVSFSEDATIGVRIGRSNRAATSHADNFDIYMTNVAFGLYDGKSVLDDLTFDVIRGRNTDENAVTTALSLPTTFSNDRFSQKLSLVWTSSDEAVISANGALTRPAKSGQQVTLTATASNGSRKDFVLYVKGKNPNNRVMTVVSDFDPENTYGKINDIYNFTLDENNNSIVYNNGKVQRVNVVRLTDGDSVARLHPDLLKLYVSDDNTQYTRIKNFKLLHDGTHWYLYGFDVQARYVKVHSTYYNGAEADFTGPLADMITAYYDDTFGSAKAFANTESCTVINSDSFGKTDYVWRIAETALQGKVQSANKADVRFYAEGELLYHYYEDGCFYVRIPYIGANSSVQLMVKSGLADALDISNKEYVYESIYGSREVRQPIAATGNRTAKTYQMSDGRLVGIDCHVSGQYLVQQYSSDGGYSWTAYEPIEASKNWIHGASGFIYDENMDRLIFLGYDSRGAITVTRLIYTDDCGATWHQLGQLDFEGSCYVDGVCLQGADGAGPNVDYLIGMGGRRYDSDGKRVGLQAYIGYSCDGGLTWQRSEDALWVDAGDDIESGISENCITQLPDGTVVMYARWQVDEADHFAVYYSHDYGVSWDNVPTPSKVYTVNTNPVFAKYQGKTALIWSGNAALGGESYRRIPLSVAISQDEMALQEFRYIQDLYSKYSLQGMDTATQNQCTNPHAAVYDDNLIIHWMNNFTAVLMLQVEDFEDYIYKTKGAYDSFEGRSAEYEGWATAYGQIAVSQDRASCGSSAMRIAQGTAVARSVPQIGHGRIGMDIYLEKADSNFSIELQAAFSNDRSANVVNLDVRNGVLGGVQLQTGWNRLEMDLALTDGKMDLLVNGASAKVTVGADVAEYICYVYVKTQSDTQLYLDDFTVEDEDESACYAASYKGVQYKDFSDACAAAQQYGDGTLKLLSNVSVEQVAVPAGVTLDLNGWKLTAESFVSMADVIDSSAGKTGTLCAEQVLLEKQNTQLPLYDGEGYRFFGYDVKLLGAKQGEQAIRFGFALEFEDEQAYALLAAGNTGLRVQTNLDWGIDGLDIAFSDELLSAYANAKLKFSNLTVALILNVSGTDTLEHGSVIRVTPGLRTDTGVGITSDAMTYTVE